MEQFINIIGQFGFPALVSFGLTYMVISTYKWKTGKDVPSPVRMVIQGVFVFLLLFVPLEIQNIFLSRLKEAVGIVAGTSALWQIIKAF